MEAEPNRNLRGSKRRKKKMEDALKAPGIKGSWKAIEIVSNDKKKKKKRIKNGDAD